MASAKLGSTTYEMTESNTPGVLQIVRRNSDGVATFFIPVSLVAEYAVEKMNPCVKAMLQAAFAGLWESKL